MTADTRMQSTFLAIAIGLAEAACGGAKPPAEDPVIRIGDETKTSEAVTFMPLEHDTVFSYDTQTDAGEKGILVLQVSRPRGERVDLKVGSHVERLQIDSLGIAYVQGGYLLKSPLTAGATWRSKAGTVRVDAVDQAVTVPAGTFKGCLRTVEESRDPTASKVVRSVYCPHVGLVSLDVEGTSDSGYEHQVVSLRSFGPRVDLGSPGVTTTSD